MLARIFSILRLDLFEKSNNEEALAILRIGIAISILFKSACYWPYLDLLHGEYGIVQKPIAEVLAKAYVPTIFAIEKALDGWGFSFPFVLETIFFVNFISALTLLCGLQARISAICCWIANAILTSSANAFNYGVDDFQLMGLFYCSIFAVDRAWSLKRRVGYPAPRRSNEIPIWIIRIHICLVYFTAGWWKISGEQWWNGMALWLALLQPMFVHQPFASFDLQTLAKFRQVFSLAGIAVAFTQLLFPFLVFVGPIRPYILGAMILFHISIGLFLGLQLFSFTLIVFDIAAFYEFRSVRYRVKSPPDATATFAAAQKSSAFNVRVGSNAVTSD
jgi:hypothetical protein